MRNHKAFCPRLVLSAFAAAAAVSVFGVQPVRAQTAGPGSSLQLPALAAQTTGTAQGPVRRLSIDEAVAMALEQNLDLQVERINPQVQDFNISVARSGWVPNFFSNVSRRSQENLPQNAQDLFTGNVSTITEGRVTTQVGLAHNLAWGGANYQVSWANGRITSNNDYSPFNPQLNSTLQAQYTQPLLRNFKIDANRQQYLISRKSREISDVQLIEAVAQTSRNVRNAYWNLVSAHSNLDVQRQSLALSQRSLKENTSRVEIGTMAPIDIIQAQAEVARQEEAVILAEAAIARAEDQLRTLISNPSQADFWNLRIEPTDIAQFVPVNVDIEGAVRNALDRRTDLNASRKQLESNDISIRYFRNQTQPDVNAIVTYSATALGGTQNLFEPGTFPPVPLGTLQRGFSSVLGDAFGGAYPTWNFQLQVNYPIGRSNAEANLARARLQNQQAVKQLESQQMAVAQQIRELGRNVNTNAKRVEATRAARALAEKRLEAEEKKFQAGMTQAFLVFQAQRDLNDARNRELAAIIAYLQSVVDFQTAQEAPLAGGGTVTPVR